MRDVAVRRVYEEIAKGVRRTGLGQFDGPVVQAHFQPAREGIRRRSDAQTSVVASIERRRIVPEDIFLLTLIQQCLESVG